MTETLDAIGAQRVIPVLRCADAEDALLTARACADGGLSIVELTTTIPGVEEAISSLADAGLTVGLGTVSEPEQVTAGVAAGAQFIVSYCARAEVIDEAHRQGRPVIPGALTPSEVDACRRLGADAVKLFPASQLSPSYLRDLDAVMPGVRCVPTGGLDPIAESLSPWLEAGAWAVGVGSGLGTVAGVGAQEVTRRARAVAALSAAGRAPAVPVGPRR